jgi:hypothetical protein
MDDDGEEYRLTRTVTYVLTARAQANSQRMMAAKSRKFHGNIHRRGAVGPGATKKKDFAVGPVMLGFFVFVVIGSSLLQIIRTASAAGPM